MELEEEATAEVEAVAAVYGDDCRVLRRVPPHVAVHILPRTAGDSSQQFVEAVVSLEAGAKYPHDTPSVDIMESKGLDEKRLTQLVTSIRGKAQELSSCCMFMALYEEAVELLSNMNYPEGQCPLCLEDLFPKNEESDAAPFMKLMSCFHCFHSQCICRWWRWIQEHNVAEGNINTGLSGSADRCKIQHHGNCPVCRKPFDSKDIEHVVHLVETDSSSLTFEDLDSKVDADFLRSEVESSRRQRFEEILEIQKQNRGLIEPKQPIAILPGMFLPEPVVTQTASDSTTDDRNATGENATVVTPETTPHASAAKPVSNPENVNVRRNRSHRSYIRERKVQPSKKWIQKGGSSQPRR